METFYFITGHLSIIFGAILLFTFVRYIIRNRKNKRILLRTLGGVMLLCALVIVPFVIVKNTVEETAFTYYSPNGLNESEDENQYSNERYGDSLNYEDHFSQVQSFKGWMDYQLRFINKGKEDFISDSWSLSIQNKFLSYQESSDSLVRDVGYLFYAIHMANLECYSSSNLRNLNDISNREMPYFNYAQALTYRAMNSWNHWEDSEAFFLQSIEKESCTFYSYEGLAELYWYFHQKEKLKALVYTPSITEMVPIHLRRQVYFSDFNWSDYWRMMFKNEAIEWGWVNAISAAVLFFFWLLFLRKLDVYEKEKWKHVILTFLLSIISMQLLYPIHDFQWGVMHYFRPRDSFSDLWYMVVSIGMVEELVKIIPLLVMIKFSKAVNEPYDYILYACIGALGFAFIENVSYYNNPFNISLRGFICYLTHMAFSAIIGYGLMLAKYRGYNKYFMFLLFFVLAAFMHGFYDYWLMDWWAIEYSWMSYVVAFVGICLLIYFTNNTLNISNFYSKDIHFNKEGLKFFGLFISILILMVGYVGVSLTVSKTDGEDYLIQQSMHLSCFILFFLLSLDAMKEIRGFIKPISIPLRGLFPNKKLNDLTGLRLNLSMSKQHPIDSDLLISKGEIEQTVQLKQRLVVDENLQSYLITLTQAIQVGDSLTHELVIIPQWAEMQFNHNKTVLTKVFVLENKELSENALVSEEELTYIGRVFSQKIN